MASTQWIAIYGPVEFFEGRAKVLHHSVREGVGATFPAAGPAGVDDTANVVSGHLVEACVPPLTSKLNNLRSNRDELVGGRNARTGVAPNLMLSVSQV